MNPCHMFGCPIIAGHRVHVSTCPQFPRKRSLPHLSELMDAEKGIGDVRFHVRDGSSHVIKRVQFDTIGGEPNGNRNDTVGEFENGNTFHVPNVIWWEVV